MPDIVLKNRDGEPQTYEGVTDVALLTTDGELISFANSGDGAKLNPPTISYTNSSGAITITNPSTNGNFTKNLKLFDNGELVGSVEYTGTGYGSKSINISTIPESESHSLTASCSGFGVLESDQSSAIDLIQVVYDLTNLTTTSPVWAYKSGSLTATITPTESSLWKRPTTVSVTYVSSGAAVTNTYDKNAGTITISASLLTEAIKITASAEVQDGVYRVGILKFPSMGANRSCTSARNSSYALFFNGGRDSTKNNEFNAVVAVGTDLTTTRFYLTQPIRYALGSGNQNYAIFNGWKQAGNSYYVNLVDNDLTNTVADGFKNIRLTPVYGANSGNSRIWTQSKAYFWANQSMTVTWQYNYIYMFDDAGTRESKNPGLTLGRDGVVMDILNGCLLFANGYSGYDNGSSSDEVMRIDADGVLTSMTKSTGYGVSVGGTLWDQYFAVFGMGNRYDSPKNVLSIYSDDFTKMPDITLPYSKFSAGFAKIRDEVAVIAFGFDDKVLSIDKDLTVSVVDSGNSSLNHANESLGQYAMFAGNYSRYSDDSERFCYIYSTPNKST